MWYISIKEEKENEVVGTKTTKPFGVTLKLRNCYDYISFIMPISTDAVVAPATAGAGIAQTAGLAATVEQFFRSPSSMLFLFP